MAKTIAIWIAVLGLAVTLLVMLASFGARQSDPTGTPNPEISVIQTTDHVQGDPASKVLLVEYSDFQCPACAVFHPWLKQLVGEYGQQFAFVYRHYPLPQHENAGPAARASEAASIQGKFWEMHDIIFEKQSEWEKASDARAVFAGYAEMLGLNKNQFLKDYDDPSASKAVEAGLASGRQFNITATPTFFLNGLFIQPQSYDDLKSIIERALASNP